MKYSNLFSTHHFSNYLCCENNIDCVFGFQESKSFLINYHIDKLFIVKNIINEILVLPESIFSINVLEKFRHGKINMALVKYEYGGTDGKITLHDLIENIFGELPDKHDIEKKEITKRKDGSFLIDGIIEIENLAKFLAINFSKVDYSTLDGFMMEHLGKIPKEGDLVEFRNYLFEVVDMDGNRVN